MDQYLPDGTSLCGGRYKIIRTIAHGGFGCTYEATHAGLGKRVAIKEFFPVDFCHRNFPDLQIGVSSEGKADFVLKLRRRFMDEARVIAGYRHPNIVAVTDIFEENGTAYYVMDYIEGGSVADLVKLSGSLPPQRAVEVVDQLCEALEHVHSGNRLHLDVKPQNLMLDTDGHIVLIDFGASKQFTLDEGCDTETGWGYTPKYAAPELMSGKTEIYCTATDIYSVGATLYKIVTGNTPPDSIAMIYGDAEFTFPPSVAESIRRAVRSAMNPKMKLRPQSIDEFRKILHGEPVTAAPEIVVPAPAEVTVIDPTPAPVKPKTPLKPLTFNVKGVEFTMIPVEGGTFQMGATPDQGANNAVSLPVHEVTLSDYYIGQVPVTKELWIAVMGRSFYNFIKSKRPVTWISWDACQKFINRLNAITGRRFSLPTEAQWEFAARGGIKSKGYRFSGSDNISDVGWCELFDETVPRKVGLKKPNELGIYDMSGNVWEWCSDWKGTYSPDPQIDPTGPKSGTRRVARGGSFGSFKSFCRVSYRNSFEPHCPGGYIGLRLALSENS